MKKNLFCIWLMLLAVLFSVNMEAQMTIGGKKEPEAFSVLELLNKGGLRLPQMTTVQRNAFAVQGKVQGEGLTIYNIDTKCVEYWNQTRWVSLCEGTSQTTISPQPCLNVAPEGTGCDQTFDITDPDCPNGPFNIAIVAGGEYAALSNVDKANGKFNINFLPNETVNIHTVLVRVTSTCTSLFKEFLFSQNGMDCSSMSYAAPVITASGTTLCAGGSVYLSVPANTANLDKLIWTRNGVKVASGVNYYIAAQKGKYNVSMGAVGCNTNSGNEKNITESGTAAPGAISILASNNGVICGTNSVTLSASGTTGSIVWFHNGVEEKYGSPVDIIGDSSVGQWFAAVKDGNCYSNQSNTIQVTKSAAGGQITIANADVLVNGKAINTFTSFCSGGSLDLSIANKQAGITYTWYNGNDVITVNPFTVPSSQTKMSLRMVASDNSGAKCPAEAHVLEANVTTGNTPGQPNITGSTVLCDGSADLTVVPAEAGTFTYTWYKDNVKMSETAQTITVTEGAVYSASVTNATGCTSILAAKTVSSTVSSLPVVSWVSNPAAGNFGAKVTLQASATFNPTAYTWTADNGAVITGSGATVSIQLPASGTDGMKVKVTVTAKNECGNSVALVHQITVNDVCPTPVITPQSALVQNGTSGAAGNVKISAANVVSPTYQWYSNTSNSNTGGSPISGAASASYSDTIGAAGTYYLYCVVTNGCTGNPKATSPVFTIIAAKDPGTIDLGSGSLSGRTCFDIAETEGGTTCGTLSVRTPLKADFTQTATNTQVYTFTPSGTVSNVHFQYVEKPGYTGQIVTSFTQSGNTVTVVYKSNLSGPQGLAKGKTSVDPLFVTIYAIFNDGTGTEKAVKLKAEIKDCMCCGAMISPTVWKAFLCHNLGADTSLNPFTDYTKPGITGGYYQWGGNTAVYDRRAILPEISPLRTQVTGWGNGVKTATDPCPAGYRVPTIVEFQGVMQNNTMTLLGNYKVYEGALQFGPALVLPFGNYTVGSGLLFENNGPFMYYSSTLQNDMMDRTSANFLSSGSALVPPVVVQGIQKTAMPIRCISEQ